MLFEQKLDGGEGTDSLSFSAKEDAVRKQLVTD